MRTAPKHFLFFLFLFLFVLLVFGCHVFFDDGVIWWCCDFFGVQFSLGLIFGLFGLILN